VSDDANALQWDGRPGHYEVYYLTLTDHGSGVGAWIRYTMVAPLQGDATCSLWFMAMDPGSSTVVGRKASFPASEMTARPDPFELRIGDSVLSDSSMSGGFQEARWDLSWTPNPRPYEPVHPLLRKAKLAKTILVLPHPDLEVAGTLAWDGREIALDGARGGQTHLWGSKHATRWAWTHCNDLQTLEGEARPGDFFEGVSVFVPRLGREIGPNTPVVGRFGGRDFASTGPLRVTRNQSVFGLTSWEVEARDRDRRLVADVTAERDELVGVTYHDPDGERAYCYNSETASMRVRVWEQEEGQWRLRHELQAPKRAHFEYAQRDPVPDVPLHVR
jgi:hypothetical protein